MWLVFVLLRWQMMKVVSFTGVTPVSTYHSDRLHLPITAAPTRFMNAFTQRLSTQLCASLKPAAIPLLDAGKALARSGELWIDATAAMGLYGGSLSAMGAQVRNAGDAVAQAAASCRFKTGMELVCDELRTSATCFNESPVLLQRAIQEARVDRMEKLAVTLGT
jgi:hypothetical protein